MGDWIMVPRTRFRDDLVRQSYRSGARQLVLLGAGFDARAYRLDGLEKLNVFEVDQQTTFDVKEPLLKEEKLSVAARHTVATEFTERGRWGSDLQKAGYKTSVPTVWLLEGLLMYLSLADTRSLMTEIGKLSAPGSVVFHDACSETYVANDRGPVVAGAKFIGGSDDYAGLWRQHGGFFKTHVRDFSSISVDRLNRKIAIDESYPEATPQACLGRHMVLFVTAEK